jgi:hypothetical protein
MHLWNKKYLRNQKEYTSVRGIVYELCDEVVFKRHECEWIVSREVAKFFKYNPRHLPVVPSTHRLTNEDYYVLLAYERIQQGYFVATLPRINFGEPQNETYEGN